MIRLILTSAQKCGQRNQGEKGQVTEVQWFDGKSPGEVSNQGTGVRALGIFTFNKVTNFIVLRTFTQGSALNGAAFLQSWFILLN
jgi:hypothetical protein